MGASLAIYFRTDNENAMKLMDKNNISVSGSINKKAVSP